MRLSNQQIADYVLFHFQRDRAMPESAIDALLAEAMLPPKLTHAEHERDMRAVELAVSL